MWACWDSDRVSSRFLGVRLGGLAIAVLMLLAPVARATSVTTVDHGTRVSIDAGKGSVTVEPADSLGASRRVVVVGPHVMVDDDGALVRVFSDVAVPEGQRVDGDVVTIFGSSRIDGHVTGNTVSVCGSVRLGPHAIVDGDMVAILGVIDRAEGATVGGESVDIGVLPPIPGIPALPSILLMVAILWLASLFGGWLVSLVIPGRLLRITATASRRTAASLLLGLASLPLALITMALLCITVIGIPVAALLPFAFIIMVWIGQYAGIYGLGLKLLRRRLGEGAMMMALLVGTLFVSLFFVAGALLAGPPGVSRTLALFLVCVGSLFGIALSIIGTGAVILSKFGATPVEVVLPAESVAPAVAAPPASAAPPLGA